MIIVEGPDGAGKTTLVKGLKEMFNLAEGQRGTDDRSKLYTVTKPDTYKALSEAFRGDHRPLIWDRLYFSDFVYAPIQGREVAFNYADRAVISGGLIALRCPLILCMPGLDVVRQTAPKVDQMDGVVENIDSIYARYENFINEAAGDYNFNVYNYLREGDYRRIADFVYAYLERRKERQW